MTSKTHGKLNTPTLSREEADKARADKAAKEKVRRTVLNVIKKAGAAMETVGFVDLNEEQRKRALEAAETKQGLSGNALASFVMEGETPKETIEKSRATKKAAAKTDKQRANVTRSADPEASGLALEAKTLAGLNSSFLPKEAKQFTELFKVEAGSADKVITVRRGDQVQELALAALQTFVTGGKDDGTPAVRKAITELGKETRLYGRKLGAFILAQRHREAAK